MSTAKHQMHKDKKTKSKPTAQDRLKARLERVTSLGQRLMATLPIISEYLVEEEAEVLLFQVKLTDRGHYLACLKIGQDPRDQIAYGQGDSPLEAMIGLESRILDRGFSNAYSYEERQQMNKDK